MTCTSGRMRSFQSLIPFGLPLRTTNATVDANGVLLCGSFFCQSAGSVLPRAAISSMSYASASVTTSASSPSITARACDPEPPCDCLISTSCPVRRFHSWANAALMSLYSSRVGSYDTLSSVTFSCAAAVPPMGATSASAKRQSSERRQRLHESSRVSHAVCGRCRCTGRETSVVGPPRSVRTPDQNPSCSRVSTACSVDRAVAASGPSSCVRS